MAAAYDVFVATLGPQRLGCVCSLTRTKSPTSPVLPASLAKVLAHSKALLAYYSKIYSLRRACQWELTAAFLSNRLLNTLPRSTMLLPDRLFRKGAILPDIPAPNGWNAKREGINRIIFSRANDKSAFTDHIDVNAIKTSGTLVTCPPEISPA
jgi:hypothetical protein